MIYKNYSYLFDEKINNIRLNNLIWNKKWASVYRQLKRVSKDYQILAKAKIKLSRREYGVDYAIKIIVDISEKIDKFKEHYLSFSLIMD